MIIGSMARRRDGRSGKVVLEADDQSGVASAAGRAERHGRDQIDETGGRMSDPICRRFFANAVVVVVAGLMASGFLAAAIASGGGFLPRQMRFDPRFELTAQHFFFFIFDFPPFFFFLPERYPPRDSPFQFSSIAVLHTLSKKDRRNEYRKSVRFDFFQSWLPAFAFLLIAGRREIAGERKLDWEPLFPVSTWPIVIDRLLVERDNCRQMLFPIRTDGQPVSLALTFHNSSLPIWAASEFYRYSVIRFHPAAAEAAADRYENANALYL